VKFSTHAVVTGNPKFTLSARPGPFKVEADAQGSLKIATGQIEARVSRVPISMRIPFLRRRPPVQVGSVGPCTVEIKPVSLEIQAASVHVDAVIAKDGMPCEVTGTVDCNMEMDLSGTIPGRITKAAIEMAADPGSDE
jgi:hypothetical protein